MNQLRRYSFLLVPALIGTALPAQGPAWNPVQAPQGARFALLYRIYQTDTAWVIEFKNLSPQKVHFSYRFPSLQSKQEAIANGRIHVNANNGRAQLPLPSGHGSPAAMQHLPLQVFDLRYGFSDQGELEPE
jgi:hypothetical protein